ncbi:MAG TPA: hypothetical protein VGK73_19705 [Polyangiaceae bacterium]
MLEVVGEGGSLLTIDAPPKPLGLRVSRACWQVVSVEDARKRVAGFFILQACGRFTWCAGVQGLESTAALARA